MSPSLSPTTCHTGDRSTFFFVSPSANDIHFLYIFGALIVCQAPARHGARSPCPGGAWSGPLAWFYRLVLHRGPGAHPRWYPPLLAFTLSPGAAWGGISEDTVPSSPSFCPGTPQREPERRRLRGRGWQWPWTRWELPVAAIAKLDAPIGVTQQKCVLAVQARSRSQGATTVGSL